MERSTRDKAIICGLYFSKFDKLGLQSLGFSTFREAFNVVGLTIGVPPATIKNYRDEFDPFFPNNRKGWHGRDLRKYCKVILDGHNHLTERVFSDAVLEILNFKPAIERVVEEKGILAYKGSSYAKRLMTGAAAEIYFQENYAGISDFTGRTLVDTTFWGCGFDFALTSDKKEAFYGIEVKGLAKKTGTITLTEKEYFTAGALQENYFLFIVSNFRTIPTHRVIRDPLSYGLNIKKTEVPRQHIYTFLV